MRIRKRPKIPISTSDLETPPTTHATHFVGGSTVVSSTSAPPPVAAGGGRVLHLDGDLLPKSSGCNTDGSIYPPGLLVPTQMEGTHLVQNLLKEGEEEVDDAQRAGFFDGSQSWDAESSFLVKKKRGGAMEVGEKKNYSTKTNKSKYSTTNGSHENCGEEKKSLKRKSPAVLMEGSRCSRVNGRGWRCCQQTLVGYSLCEHHLGKGRLRSVNNNNNNISHVKFKNNNKRKDEEEEMKAVISGRKRKIGFVKARSISSLLDQTINSDVNSNSNVFILPPKDEVLVPATASGRTDQVSSMEVSSATMV